jgi:hypothetical protein
MEGQFLLSSHEPIIDHNIYADKSSLVLKWLLEIGIKKKQFSIREVERDVGVSVGLVQRIFGILTLRGYLQTTGLRTAKKFFIKKPEILLKIWLEQYNIVKKCKVWTYRSGFQGREQLLDALIRSNLQHNVILALHSAAEAYKCKNTNLQTLELYLMESNLKPQIEEVLQLEPQERGYEVLLVEPYYKSMLNIPTDFQKQDSKPQRKHLLFSPLLLTFLDLYHFPLRGREQAEFMAERIPELKRIYKKD